MDRIIETLASAARDGATVVTANQRLAREWRRRFDRQQTGAGLRAWTPVRILPWSAWVQSLWLEAVTAGAAPPARRLTSDQAEFLWRAIIEDAPEFAAILQPRAAALSAMSAWNLIEQYRIPWKRLAFGGHDDWTAFASWARAFERRCAARNWIDDARIADAATLSLAKRQLRLPPRLVLGGFDELTPQQTFLLDALEAAGVPHSKAQSDAGPARDITRFECLDPAAEMRAAAQWARDRLAEDGNARIGVVVPAISARRALAEHVFTEVLHPSWIAGFSSGRPLFHISLGRPLEAWPVVHAALKAMDLRRPELPIGEASAIARSPFFRGNYNERYARGVADVKMRRGRPAEVRASEVDPWGVSRMPLPHQQAPSGWADSFSQMLDTAGWPGDEPLNSAEYQTVEAWRDLLRRFASLDAVAGPLLFEQAAARLREMASAAEFQPEDLGAPVQIIGALEAAGASYDHLWIAGLDDETWPQPARPHPFLPPSLQIEYHLPHCSAEREFEFAANTTRRLFESAPHIVVSSALRDGDRVLRPSVLIRDLPLGRAGFELDDYRRLLERRAEMETIADDMGPALDAAAAPGGAGILKQQALCPFRAFATFRLGARPLEAGTLGVDPAEHGNVLHKALEIFWGEVPSRDALLSYPAAELQPLIRECARRAVARMRGAPAGELDRRFRRLEIDRVEWVLGAWLEVERTRPPFEVVHREQSRQVTVGGLDLLTRIDRADRLPNGDLVILDYKSTAPSLKAWEGDRLSEPQLPLYAASMEEPLAAVAFAQLTPGELKFKGFGEGDALPEVRHLKKGETLGGRIVEWRRALEMLAREFHDGRATVDPKKGACQYCGLDALCRIHEHRTATDAEDADV